ncbi:MAG: hypothetical protein GY950_30980 [bacterium]|nr:hypothetical protein [bacterium]
MSAAKTHIQSIIGAVETLGYTFTDEYFDFDTVPASGDDDVYRVEGKTGEVGSISGNRVEKRKEFAFWFAFKLASGSNRKQDFYDVLDAQEDMEDEIFEALTGIQVKIIENIMSAIKSDYIIVKLTGEVIYWRDLTV